MTTNEEDVVVEVPEITPVLDDEGNDTTDWKAIAEERQELAKKNHGIAQRYKTKFEKAKEPKVEPVVPKVEPTGNKQENLDDTQLDYLDLKGFTEEEDIKVIQSVMQKTGQTVRQALKDEYVIAKLKDLKVARDVKTATPSANKRSGQQATDNEDYWFQKYESSGELPKGMPAGMAIKLVNRKASHGDTSIPAFAR